MGTEVFSKDDIAKVERLAPRVIEMLEYFSSVFTMSRAADELKSLPSTEQAKEATPQRANIKDGAFSPILEVAEIGDVFKVRLSPRERSVISMTLNGKSVDNIAQALNISPHTVRVHMRNAYAKLQVRNRLELFAMFLRQVDFQSREEGSLSKPRA